MRVTYEALRRRVRGLDWAVPSPLAPTLWLPPLPEESTPMPLPQHPDPRSRRLRVLPPISDPRSVPVAAWHALRTSVQQWAVDSQRAACRNAMVAGTALAARRAEREDVEEFLAAREGRPTIPAPRTEDGPGPGRSARA